MRAPPARTACRRPRAFPLGRTRDTVIYFARSPAVYFRIDPSSGVPLGLQIKSGLRLLIAKGLLGIGERLPSARDLGWGAPASWASCCGFDVSRRGCWQRRCVGSWSRRCPGARSRSGRRQPTRTADLVDQLDSADIVLDWGAVCSDDVFRSRSARVRALPTGRSPGPRKRGPPSQRQTTRRPLAGADPAPW